ncbi:tetratricopeptide repeat protein [Gelidibacter sp. F63206]|uniref:tetratricopeptide repeat protein n=1 Tax=Gelidibacter sp. F63206 TaxID=2926425 RepID=UPI001FF19A06|nr:CDC27 family protein [Gelidibacter sp. F63206]MCK0115051.1 CDC27 family protein [Gelidibacter sp. F63206]
MKPQIEITQLEWDLIERYLEQDKASDKKLMLNEELTQIPNVDAKIAHIKQVREQIEDRIRQSKIKEFHEHISVDENDTKVKILSAEKMNPKLIWYAIAAVLVVSFGVLWMFQSSNSPEKIFVSHFEADPGLRTVMGASNEYDFYEGMVVYKRQEYKEAINWWQKLLPEKTENDTLNYFLGVAYLAEGNAEKSLEYLEPASKFNEGIFTEDAAHYTALAKIKLGKIEEAKQLLKAHPSDRNNKLLYALNE